MLGNRIKETTSDNFGTGNVTTLAVATNYQTFNTVFGTDRKFYYTIIDGTANLWETGQGHLSASTTLVRDEIIDNSSGTATAINFANTNEKTIICAENTRSACIGFQGYRNLSTLGCYGNEYVGQGNLAFTPGSNTAYLIPFRVPVSMTCTGVGYYHTTNSSASGDKYMFGVYETKTDGEPGALLRTTALVDLSTGSGSTSTESWTGASGGDIKVYAGESYYLCLAVGNPTTMAVFKGFQAFGKGVNQMGITISAGHYRWGTMVRDFLLSTWTSLSDPADNQAENTFNEGGLILTMVGSIL